MGNNPEKRNKDSRMAAENNIEQPPPLDKRDPNEPVRVGTEGQANAKGDTSAGAGQAL